MLDAILVLEPENEFDPTAVAVFIDGKKVGHIPKDDSIFGLIISFFLLFST